MRIIGITGSIASGKTSLVKLLKNRSISIFNADKIAHHLLNHEALPMVLELFPDVAERNHHQITTINRQKLAKIVFSDEKSLAQLEKIMHPLVRKKMFAFIKQSFIQRRSLILLDIPLLFENKLYGYCDDVILADILPHIQKRRLQMIRKMPENLQKSVLKKQMPLHEKRKHTNDIIFMNLERGLNKRQAIALLQKIKARKKTGFHHKYVLY